MNESLEVRKMKSEMENKNETMKELDPNQMEQISGGATKIRVCPYCGQQFTSEIKFLAHGKKCRIEHQGIRLDGTISLARGE